MLASGGLLILFKLWLASTQVAVVGALCGGLESETLSSSLIHSLCFADACDLGDQVGGMDATLMNGTECVPDEGLVLDGLDDYADLVPVQLGWPLTIAIEAKWSAFHKYSRLLNFESDKDSIFLSTDDENAAAYGLYISDGDRASLGGWSVDVDTFFHIAVTIGETSSSLYVDGALIANHTQTASPANFTRYWLGKPTTGDNGHEYFNGSIRSLQIWNRKLTAYEVMTLAAPTYLALWDGLTHSLCFSKECELSDRIGSMDVAKLSNGARCVLDQGLVFDGDDDTATLQPALLGPDMSVAVTFDRQAPGGVIWDIRGGDDRMYVNTDQNWVRFGMFDNGKWFGSDKKSMGSGDVVVNLAESQFVLAVDGQLLDWHGNNFKLDNVIRTYHTFGWNFKGSISSYHIWNRQLVPDEVAALHAINQGGCLEARPYVCRLKEYTLLDEFECPAQPGDLPDCISSGDILTDGALCESDMRACGMDDSANNCGAYDVYRVKKLATTLVLESSVAAVRAYSDKIVVKLETPVLDGPSCSNDAYEFIVRTDETSHMYATVMTAHALEQPIQIQMRKDVCDQNYMVPEYVALTQFI